MNLYHTIGKRTIMKITKVKNDFTGALGEEVEITSISQLESFTRDHAWSPYLFNREDQVKANGEAYKLHRLKQNFKEAYFFAIDIDDGMKIEDARSVFCREGFVGFINTSQSHQISKDGKEPTDRYRIVFQLSRPITKSEEVLGTFLKLKKLFPTMDEACKDEARFFKASKEKVHITVDGKLLEPEIYKSTESISNSITSGLQLSKSTDEFLVTYWEEGNRHGPLVKACMNAGQQGWNKDAFKEVLNYGLNPWLKASKHQGTIDDIFDNERWGDGLPTVYAEQQQKMSGSIQKKWIRVWLNKNKVAVMYDESLFINGKIVPKSDVTRKIRLAANHNNLLISNQQLDDEVDEYIEKMRYGYLEEIKTKLNRYNPTGIEQLEKFLKHLGGKNYKEMDLFIIMHFMWNVKRRINNMETYREVMPVIVGDQGIGKSYNIKNKLLSPLANLWKSTSFSQLDDGRELKMLSNNFVLLFDEMAYANKSDVNNVKRLITEQTYSMRRMRETSHEVLAKNAQFIGTSNNSLTSSITDTTGMRRFYEVECAELSEIPNILDFYEGFNSLNYDLMWQSVDHLIPSPILNHLPKLNNIQEQYTSKDPIREWIENSGEITVMPKDQYGDQASDLLRNFNTWFSGYKYSSVYFGIKLQDRTFSDIIKTRTNTGTFYNLKINKEPGGFNDF